MKMSSMQKYYSINECNKLHLNQKHFSVYHTNIINLSKHIDALDTQLSMINISFDIIGKSETKHQINKVFLVNVDMQGCSMYTQLSKNSCGGCAIYVNSQLDHLVRNDLSALEEEYETLWVEINNHKAKDFLFCCLYWVTQIECSCLIKREMHNKRGIFKIKIILNCK